MSEATGNIHAAEIKRYLGTLHSATDLVEFKMDEVGFVFCLLIQRPAPGQNTLLRIPFGCHIRRVSNCQNGTTEVWGYVHHTDTETFIAACKNNLLNKGDAA